MEIATDVVSNPALLVVFFSVTPKPMQVARRNIRHWFAFVLSEGHWAVVLKFFAWEVRHILEHVFHNLLYIRLM